MTHGRDLLKKLNSIGMRRKIIRITTVPVSLKILLKGQLKFVNNQYDVIAVSSFGKELKEVEEIEGVKIYPVEMSRKISPLNDILSIYKLYKLFKKESPYIVHSHTPKAGFVAMTAAFLAGVPNRLHTVAGLPLMESRGIKRMILLNVEKLTYCLSTLILPNSFGLKDFIIKNNLTSERKLKILGNGSSNGIDLSYFQSSNATKAESYSIKEKYGLNDKLIFLFIGRIVSHKGIDELINAFSLINNKYPQTILLLVGDMENSLYPLSTETKQNLLHPCVIRVGYQTDVRCFLELADIFVFPSYREGFPNVVLQACAFNLPCIVTDIAGSNEIIKNNINGILVPPKDAGKLAEAMELFTLNPQFRKEMGAGNRKSVAKIFEQPVIWELILNLYDSL